MVQFQNYKKFKLLKVGEYMKTIVRKNYLNRIIELKDTPDIKIITGIRRSGKSKLMQSYIEYLKTNYSLWDLPVQQTPSDLCFPDR